MAQAVSSSLSLQRPKFAPGSAHMGFMADKVAMGQVFLRVFLVFLCQHHFTVAFHTHITWHMSKTSVGGRSWETIFSPH
jgi:hypothetical protein